MILPYTVLQCLLRLYAEERAAYDILAKNRRQRENSVGSDGRGIRRQMREEEGGESYHGDRRGCMAMNI